MNTNSRRASPRGRHLASLLAASLLLALGGSALAGPAADDNARAGVDALNAPNQPAATFRYVRIPATSFQPRSDASVKEDETNGCIYRDASASDDRWEHKLVLPEGAQARYLRIYYYDNNAGGNVRVWYTTYDGLGGYTDLDGVNSTDAGGYGTTLGVNLAHLVDPYAEATNIIVGLGDVTDGTVAFCGVRVAYYDPVPDRIFMNGFQY